MALLLRLHQVMLHKRLTITQVHVGNQHQQILKLGHWILVKLASSIPSKSFGKVRMEKHLPFLSVMTKRLGHLFGLLKVNNWQDSLIPKHKLSTKPLPATSNSMVQSAEQVMATHSGSSAFISQVQAHLLLLKQNPLMGLLK